VVIYKIATLFIDVKVITMAHKNQSMINRMKEFKNGDLISFNIGGAWFIQYVDSTSGELCKNPYLWCKRIGKFRTNFLWKKKIFHGFVVYMSPF
jgi:hypothetical protein